jgi:hypothetical protein
MKDKVKLRESIIVNGLPYTRESYIERAVVEGTRFDAPEFLIERDDPDYKQPAWTDTEVLDVNMQESEPPPETIVKPRYGLKKKLARKV